MALDIGGLLVSAPQIFRDLPFILFLIQTVFYLSLVFTFGSIVAKGYRGYLPWYGRLGLRLGMGFLALVTGIGISGFFPVSSITVYVIIQKAFINIILGVIVSTIVLYIAVYLISHNIFNVKGMQKTIEKLQAMIKKAGEVSARNAQLKGFRKHLDVFRVSGIVLLSVFLVFSFLNFQGFPSIMGELGLTQESLEAIAGQIEGISEQYGDIIGDIGSDPEALSGCVEAVGLIDQPEVISGAEEYSDPAVKGMMEARAGENMLSLRRLVYKEKEYFLGIGPSKICLSTRSVVCACQELSAGQ